MGVYRRADATFVVPDAFGRAARPVVVGSPGARDALPLAGDWDGDGRDTVGVYCRSDASFVLTDGTAEPSRRSNSDGRLELEA